METKPGPIRSLPRHLRDGGGFRFHRRAGRRAPGIEDGTADVDGGNGIVAEAAAAPLLEDGQGRGAVAHPGDPGGQQRAQFFRGLGRGVRIDEPGHEV